MNLRYQDLLFVLALAAIMIPINAHAFQNGGGQTVPAKGYTLIETAKYSIQVPTGWTVGKETPWGATDITPKSGPGQMGAMTAGPTADGWDALYKMSLYFIKREEAGTETPYRTGKTKQGYDSMSFEVLNAEGFADRRYTLLKSSEGKVLALSIKIPSAGQEKPFKDMFQHMVDTAVLR